MYHTLITMSWSRFNLLVLCIYLVANLLFASLYLIAGTDSLEGAKGINMMGKFWDAFFFSAQTITTVGYGKISPQGFYPNIIAAVESMMGLLGFALATGLLYGRFSRPEARIKFSAKALRAPYKSMNAFMFRIVNERKNQLIEVEAAISVAMLDETDPKNRKFFNLKLELTKINFFPMSWTIVHPIDENSPLWGMTEADFKQRDIE